MKPQVGGPGRQSRGDNNIINPSESSLNKPEVMKHTAIGGWVIVVGVAVLIQQVAVLRAKPGYEWRAISDLERDSSQQQALPRSPVLIGHGRNSYLFSRNNGRFLLPHEELRQANLFQCVEPRRSLYENFIRQYNRTFEDAADRLERGQLFAVTLKRAIVLNRVIQNEIMNSSNQATRNYHFIEPLDNQNLALWYADVTDCELGLIKNVLLDTFHLIDENKHHVALRILQDQGRTDLPGLLNADGFEQLASILLARLFDRFRGDEKMNQLFEWPMYFKRLAAYAYAQQQARQADHKTKMALVAFAYPAYFKDLKYNQPAVNRTNDNIKANSAHQQFNQLYNRQLGDLKALNRRLSIFRQRWSLVNMLNSEQSTSEANDTSRALLPDWLRAQQFVPDETFDDTVPSDGDSTRSERLRLEPSSTDLSSPRPPSFLSDASKPFKLTSFSDLTDNEFQAFLSNDFSLLNGNKESAGFLDSNFPVRPLTESFRWEIAHELEMRHGMQVSGASLELLRRGGDLMLDSHQLSSSVARPSLKLAKQVVDELIGDVGLPIGPAALEGISEDEQVRMFQKVANFFQKPYLPRQRTATTFGAQPSDVDLLDEQRLRLESFKENYPRFKAWFIKEGWSLSDQQLVAMLRLADMSWREIKLSMFKLCCLTSDNLIALSSSNATIQYLGSNYDMLCVTDEFGSDASGASAANDLASVGFGEPPAKLKQTPQQQQQQQQKQSASELAALEIYYYYLVHFNKHHLNKGAEFARRFAVFRANIESVRRHSCKRSLTLYESLKDKRSDLLSTVDVLDPRRSHTDDLNLDRFEFFRLPSREPPLTVAVPPLAATARRAQVIYSGNAPSSGSARTDSSRAGLSYRRDHFSDLLDRANTASSSGTGWWGSTTGYQTVGQAGGADPSSQTYANKLFDSWESVDEATSKYRQNNVGRIYQLVMARYKWCRQNVDNIDLSSANLRQQCQADGRLGDQAARLGSNALWTEDAEGDAAAGGGGGLRQQQQHQQKFERLVEQDKCAYYRRGLDPWGEGLIKQEAISAQLIQLAKC